MLFIIKDKELFRRQIAFYRKIKEDNLMKMKQIKMRIMACMAMAVMTVATFGTGVAAAASGSEAVGGGQWSWSNVPGVYASSSYYHGSKLHSASAQVGSGDVVVDTKNAGHTAKATVYGIGTTRVWWNTY